MADIEVPTCRSTITALFNKAYAVCTYFSCISLIICQRASGGNASLSL